MNKFANPLIIKVIRIYKLCISPFLGSRCRFYPSCSSYAEEAFHKKSFLSAVGMVTARLLKCHPFHKGGYDPIH